MPENETLLWRAILGPQGMDPAIVEMLGAVIEAAVNDPSYVEFLATKGEVPNVVLGADLGARLQAEFDALAEVSAALGLGQ